MVFSCLTRCFISAAADEHAHDDELVSEDGE